MDRKETWSSLDLKTKIAYVTAIVAFIAGWLLTFGAFCIPPIAEVADSILWILGQSLLYAASVLGIGMYITGSVRGMKRAIGQFMREEDRRFRNNEEYIPEEEIEENDA